MLALSAYQRVLWHWEQRHPGTATMHLVRGLTVKGRLDTAALARAVDREFARHDALRVRLAMSRVGVTQCYTPATAGALEHHRFVDGTMLERRAAARAFAQAEAARPFALVGDALARALLIELSDVEHVIVFFAHRIALDGEQFWTLFHDVFAIYNGAELPAPRMQYGAFVAWQAQLLAQPSFDDRLAACRARLAGAEPVALPYDRPTPGVRSVEVHVANVGMPAGLAAFARANGSTTFGVYLAGFQALLAERTAHPDITLLVPFRGANKVSRDLAATFGRLEDFLFVRTAVDRDASFGTLLRRARTTMRAGYDTSEIPAAAIIGDDAVHDHPLGRVMLNVLSAGSAEFAAHGLVVERDAVPRGKWLRTNDLEWWILEEVGLSLLAGAADVFDPETIRDLAQQLTAMLARAVAAPDTIVRELGAAPTPVATYLAPATPTELALARIWGEVLGLEQVSADANFLELGGVSLTATRVVARIALELGVEIPLRAMFEQATVASVAARVEQRRGTVIAPPIAQARAVEQPPSFAQQRLWLIDQIAPGTALYNLPIVFRFTGALDAAALEHTLQDLHRRHEVLRSRFVNRGGDPVVVIADDAFALQRADVAAASREQIGREIARPFDLAAGPPWRALLIREADDGHAHVLVVTMHHIVSDGWSVDIFAHELERAYAARIARQPSPLAPLPLQYADFAAWQRARMTGDRLARELAYWKHELAGAPAVLELPLDRPRPTVASYRGGRHVIALSPALSRELAALCTARGVTLYMVMLAAFQTLLYRYAGQDDILVGTPIAGRTVRDLERSLGCFVNTLVMRAEFSARPRFGELLAQVRETALDAYSHQELPFDKLVDELAPHRNLSHAAVFQAFFQLDRPHATAFSVPGMTTVPPPAEDPPAKFDLHMAVTDGESIQVRLAFARDLFDDPTIARMAEHYHVLLRSIVADPDGRVDELPLLPAGERQRVVVDWNRTDVPLPSARGIHEHIADQVRRTPEAIALAFEGAQLTYRELDRRANQVAHHLRTLGVGTDAVVGVVLERSLEMVIGLLGILKAGGAYLPIDPSYPAERIAFMLEDARLAIVLTSVALRDGLRSDGIHVVCLDDPASPVHRALADAPAPAILPDQLAYVIYTSGSTGKPKGAMTEHRAIANRLLWMQSAYPLTAADRVLQKTPVSFDVSVWELFWPLMVGARLVIARPGGHRDSAYLARVIDQQQITTLHFVPSMLAAFLAEPRLRERCRSVTRVICSGEALPLELQTRFFEQLDAELHNLYGPTEAAVDVSAWACARAPGQRAVPIGRPIANTALYVLDRELQPVPIGVAGELFIGGVAVGRGYRGRPALTAARFVPDPFGGPGARLYRTGDLTRWRADGAIDYLGRLDHQVKLRGFRIELGEIEAALARDGGLQDVVVIAHGDHEDMRLVAYLVARDPSARPALAELRRALGETLPDYMIPTAFVWLEALPLSPNGKVDRKALPAPRRARTDGEHVEPRTVTEEALAGIWSRLLAVERVGADDNFFHLGGNSLMVMRLVARISAELGVELTPREVFERPTLAAQAERVDDTTAGEMMLDGESVEAQLAAELADVEPAEARRALLDRLVAQHRIDAFVSQPLPRRAAATSDATFGQRRMWDLNEIGDPVRIANPQAFALRGPLDPRALRHAIAGLVARQAALRSVFALDPARDTLVQTVCDRGPELEVIDLASVAEHERLPRARALFDAIGRRYELGREAFRVQLVRFADDHHVLLLAAHHIVLDGVSRGVLWSDLTALYRGADLPALDFEFADFCAWQTTLADRLLGKRQLAFWASTIAGYDDLELVGDLGAPPRARGPVLESYPLGLAPFAIEGRAWDAVRELCAQLGVLPYSVTATALLLFLTGASGRPDACIMSGNHHRQRPGSEKLIGNFVTPYPLRVAFDDAATLAQAVRHCDQAVLTHREHQGVGPTTALVKWSEVTRYNLNYQVTSDDDRMPGLGAARVEPLAWPLVRQTIQDLALYVRQTPSGIRGALHYNAARFSPALAGRIVERLRGLIEAIATAPADRVAPYRAAAHILHSGQ